MIDPLRYETLERLALPRPVERVGFIAGLCAGKRVLDIGCLDETAHAKRDTEDWLHGRIGTVARNVVGIDNSAILPKQGLVTGPNARIFRGNGVDPDPQLFSPDMFDIIVAGEFIEHLENPLGFLKSMRERFAGREMVISTPNGVAFANALLATIGCEAQHPDHLLTSTYKTLNTLCRRSGVQAWEIIPYRFYATEMLLKAPPAQRLIIRVTQHFVRAVEWLMPLRGFGYIVRITL